jgi:rhamnosyltransferase
MSQLNHSKNIRVAIFMATYNGIHWVEQQVHSLLNQRDVDVKIFISDDCSIDGTYEYLSLIEKDSTRVLVLPRIPRIGSAGGNFYRLVKDVDIKNFDYVAFADQDDIWNLDKLSRHIQLIKKNNAEAVSSNVLAFWPDGQQKLIVKSQSQKNYDFLFESAGPGCSFLMTPWLINQVKSELDNNEFTHKVAMHDWLTYAICRAHGKKWIIDPFPSLLYRQHKNNVIGANARFKGLISRLKKIKCGWYRHQVTLISKIVASISPDPNLHKLERIIQFKSARDQFRLIPFAVEGRRKRIDRFVLIISIILFIF